MALQRLLVEINAECADLYHFGLDTNEVAASGLIPLELDGPVIIPNYYEPFVQKNVGIMMAFKLKSGQHVIAMKADADQDRPNQI